MSWFDTATTVAAKTTPGTRSANIARSNRSRRAERRAAGDVGGGAVAASIASAYESGRDSRVGRANEILLSEPGPAGSPSRRRVGAAVPPSRRRCRPAIAPTLPSRAVQEDLWLEWLEWPCGSTLATQATQVPVLRNDTASANCARNDRPPPLWPLAGLRCCQFRRIRELTERQPLKLGMSRLTPRKNKRHFLNCQSPAPHCATAEQHGVCPRRTRLIARRASTRFENKR